MSNVSNPFGELDILLQCFCTSIFMVRNQTDALRKKLAHWMVVRKKEIQRIISRFRLL